MNLFSDLKRLYEDGENINLFLQNNPELLTEYGLNASDSIAISYDLQSCSYVQGFFENHLKITSYCDFIFEHLTDLGVVDAISSCTSRPLICDFGTGESTRFSPLIKRLSNHFTATYLGMDISLSRLSVARRFTNLYLSGLIPSFFIGDLKSLPLLDRSIDLSITIHALEPNGGFEKDIITEIARVARSYCVFVEPDYERGSPEQKARMTKFGYVKGISSILSENTQLELISEIPIPPELGSGTSNESTIYVCKKNGDPSPDFSHCSTLPFACPIEKSPLSYSSDFYTSLSGVCYPVIDKFPVLTRKNAIPYYHFRNLSIIP